MLQLFFDTCDTSGIRTVCLDDVDLHDLMVMSSNLAGNFAMLYYLCCWPSLARNHWKRRIKIIIRNMRVCECNSVLYII